jgi:hypothetical protein
MCLKELLKFYRTLYENKDILFVFFSLWYFFLFLFIVHRCFLLSWYTQWISLINHWGFGYKIIDLNLNSIWNRHNTPNSWWEAWGKIISFLSHVWRFLKNKIFSEHIMVLLKYFLYCKTLRINRYFICLFQSLIFFFFLLFFVHGLGTCNGISVIKSFSVWL